MIAAPKVESKNEETWDWVQVRAVVTTKPVEGLAELKNQIAQLVAALTQTRWGNSHSSTLSSPWECGHGCGCSGGVNSSHQDSHNSSGSPGLMTQAHSLLTECVWDDVRRRSREQGSWFVLENVYLKILSFNILWLWLMLLPCYGLMLLPFFYIALLEILVDVITKIDNGLSLIYFDGWCYCPCWLMECHWCMMWLMLLPLFSSFGWCSMPLVADGKATDVWYGRCYYQLADVIANRMEWVGRCYGQCGRCNSHWVFMFILI